MTSVKTIYESPDNGLTVYERRFGSSQRTLIKSPSEPSLKHELNLWRDIIKESKTNAALADMLEKTRSLYFLSKNEN
jgi:hypothetical protein